MIPRYDGSTVRADEQAREQFYDARGYGRPTAGELELAPVEAAHLLFRGDIEAIADDRPSGERIAERLDFQDFLASQAVSEVAFFVYADLRERGFYLSPVRETTSDGDRQQSVSREFEVYPRGDGPWDDRVAYRVLAISEREAVAAVTLESLAAAAPTTDDPAPSSSEVANGEDDTASATGVLAVVDEESEVTYLGLSQPRLHGTSEAFSQAVQGRLLSDRVLVPDPPAALYERSFYGQPLDREHDALQLSLVEAAHLAERDRLSLAGTSDGPEAVMARGREVEGERFDRRIRVYSALRSAGLVPKTGYKFGADFRTYAHVESVENLGHSERLVRVQPADVEFSPRDLALDVRLAHGVRKQILYALAAETELRWLAVERLTP